MVNDCGTPIRLFSWLSAIAIASLVAMSANVVQAACTLSTPSGYRGIGGGSSFSYATRSQCNSVNSSYFKNKGTCSCTGSSGGTSYTPGSMTPEMLPYFAATTAMRGFMDGVIKGLERNRQRALARQRELQRQTRLAARRAQERAREEERKRQAASRRARERMLAIKRRLLGDARDLGAGGLGMRDLGGGLSLKEQPGAFGNPMLVPRDLARDRAPPPNENLTLTALQRAQCSANILKRAADLARGGDYDNAAFLSHEANRVVVRAGYRPQADCGSLLALSTGQIAGRETPESKRRHAALIAKLHLETLAASRLMIRVNQQVADYRKVEIEIDKTDKALKEANIRHDAAKRRVDVLKNEALLDSPDQTGKESLLAEALAALKDAERAHEDAEDIFTEVKEAQEDMKAKIKQSRDLFARLENDPEKGADFVLKVLDGNDAVSR